MELRLVLSTLIYCVLMVRNKSESNSACSLTPQAKGDPEKPLLNFSYTTQIAGKWVDRNTKEYIYEYYDAEHKQLAYSSMWTGFKYTEIYDLGHDTLLYSIDGDCRFLSNYSRKDISNDGMRSLELFLGLGKVWKYIRTTVIRGIEVQQWSSCGHWGDYVNFTADYYFTKKDKTPFRMELKGIEKPRKDKDTHFQRIYDYFMFHKGTPSSDAFKPPPGEFCSSSIQMTPPFPMFASYRTEEMDPLTKTVINKDVYFNKQLQISKEESEDETIIRDFKRGIQFHINKNGGECKRSPFYRVRSFDQTVDKHGIIHMATLKHFFLANGNFTKNGVYKTRGISCDLYTKKTHAAEDMGASIVEIYFARPNVNVVNNQGRVSSALSPVVRVLLKGGTPTVVKKQYEIYDFDAEEFPTYNPFDLSKCFSQEKTVKFSMIYTGQIVDSWDWNLELMKKTAEIVSKALAISFLRVSVTNAIVGEGQIIIYGSLFEAESYFTVFETIPNREKNKQKNTKSWFVYRNSSNTPTICSEYCSDLAERPFESSLYCSAFEFDRSNKNCIFFFGYYNPNGILKYSYSIDIYRRTSPAYRDSTSVLEAWGKLQRKVAAGSINYTDDNGAILQAISISKRDVTEERTQQTDHPMSQFFKINGIIKLPPVESISYISKGACARHCLTSLSYNCEAFMYNSKNKKCLFYDSNSHRPRNAQQSTKAIEETFARDYSSNFEIFMGRALLSPASDSVYTGIDDINGCAELCVKTQDYFCQSFEMCGETCLLGRTHIYETPSSGVKQDLNCVHFSRNYINDYSKMPHKKALGNSHVVVFASIGVKKCATMCSTSLSYDCDVFEYCDADSLCRLTTTTVKNTDNLVYQSSGDCDLYSRKKGVHRFINTYSKLNSDSNGANYPGAMVGMAIGMFLIGVILFIATVLVVLKFRSHNIIKHNSTGVSMDKLSGGE